MRNDDYTENIRVLAAEDLETAAKEIDIARRRISEVIIQLNSAGAAIFIPQLHVIEDQLYSVKFRTNSILQSLKVSEIAKKSENEAKRTAFGFAMIDALYCAGRVVEILGNALALTVGNSAVSSDKVMDAYTGLDIAEKFKRDLRKILPNTLNDTRSADD